ncbi:hypothetical protein [Echinicola salinicaeni]|uniref:hypothetical protein n=1 Tax=Echinicola salinicaeni TaxID=2762757 RepID=UPI0016460854|nr:hypothetical protein [Echinicola salinicaeni]
MKKSFKSNWLHWTVAGVFGAMLVFNVMISLDFEKGKFLPSLTLMELGNQAYAVGEDEDCVSCDNTDETTCQRVIVGNETHYYTGPKESCD